PPPPLHSFPTRRSSDLIQSHPYAAARNSYNNIFAVSRIHADRMDSRMIVAPAKPFLPLWPIPERFDQFPGSPSIIRAKEPARNRDRKSTRLNSSHVSIS